MDIGSVHHRMRLRGIDPHLVLGGIMKTLAEQLEAWRKVHGAHVKPGPNRHERRRQKALARIVKEAKDGREAGITERTVSSG